MPRPRGRSPMSRGVSVVDPGGDELDQAVVVAPDHAQGAVARARELASRTR